MGWTDIEQKRANNREWAARLSERWRAAGGCTKCGLPVQRFTKCFACRQRHVQWVLASRRRKRQETQVA